MMHAIEAALAAMGRLVQQQLVDAQVAQQHASKGLITLVLNREQAINRAELEIDAACQHALEMGGSDVRICLRTVRIARDLERMSDELKKIASKALVVQSNNEIDMQVFIELTFMAEQARRNVAAALDAIFTRDTQKAQDVLATDIRLDAAFEATLRHTVSRMAAQPRVIASGIDIVFIAKAWERVGDHAKNIAEQMTQGLPYDAVPVLAPAADDALATDAA
jgi:phosphate transport system protein